MELIMENFNKEKYNRAKKRVDDLKGFYIHFTVYIAVNVFILINIGLRTDNIWQWGHFATPFFWGIGVFFHWWHTFGKNPFFGKGWEERQIQKYMDQENEDARKFRR